MIHPASRRSLTPATVLWLLAAALLASILWATASSGRAEAAPQAATASSAGRAAGAATPAPRVQGLPTLATQDPRAFPGSSAAAVRQQVAGCVVPQKLGVVYLIDDSGSMGGNDYGS